MGDAVDAVSAPPLSSPLLLGTDADDARFSNVVSDVVSAVPWHYVTRRVKGGMRPVSATFKRELVWSEPDPQKSSRLVKLMDRAQDREYADANHIIWTVRIGLFGSATFPDFAARCSSVVRLDVEYLEFCGHLSGASQLAMLRHLLWLGYVDLDSRTTAVGDHSWRPEWWPDGNGAGS